VATKPAMILVFKLIRIELIVRNNIGIVRNNVYYLGTYASTDVYVIAHNFLLPRGVHRNEVRILRISLHNNIFCVSFFTPFVFAVQFIFRTVAHGD